MEKISYNYSPEHWKNKQDKKCKWKHNFTKQNIFPIHEPEIANSGQPIVPRKYLASFKLTIFKQT